MPSLLVAVNSSVVAEQHAPQSTRRSGATAGAACRSRARRLPATSVGVDASDGEAAVGCPADRAGDDARRRRQASRPARRQPGPARCARDAIVDRRRTSASAPSADQIGARTGRSSASVSMRGCAASRRDHRQPRSGCRRSTSARRRPGRRSTGRPGSTPAGPLIRGRSSVSRAGLRAGPRVDDEQVAVRRLVDVAVAVPADERDLRAVRRPRRRRPRRRRPA